MERTSLFIGLTRAKTALVTVILMGLAAFATPAAAQDTDSAESRAFLVTPLSFVKQFDLHFGDIIPSDTDGTVVIDPAGGVTTTGGVQVITTNAQAARFWGYGTFRQLVRVNFDANQYTLTRVGGTETMTMNTTTVGSVPPVPLGASPRIFRIGNPDGYFAFGVGATLEVDADQAPGTYESTFTITLEYI